MLVSFASGALLVLDAAALQRMALRAGSAVSAEKGAKADGFRDLSDQGVDDREVGHDYCDKSLTAGP